MSSTNCDSGNPAPVGRKELHFRRIDMRGYERDDGLFEVEGRVVDRKPEDFVPANGEYSVPANEPIHNLGVRLVFDSDFVVQAVETFTEAAPYRACPEGGRALQSLKGLRIGPGWGKEIRQRLGGGRSCTHLTELLMPLATIAIQSMSGRRKGLPDVVDENGKPRMIDSCYAYASSGEIVMRRWPQFHTPPEPPKPQP